MIGLDWKLLLSLTDARGEHCCVLMLTMCVDAAELEG